MSRMVYIAHINELNEIQTIKQHSEKTAELCREFAISELKSFMYNIGLLHDIGKYQPSFQKRINGNNIKIEHSICGAREVENRYHRIISKLMQYCIAGHHSGMPDGGFQNDTHDLSTLYGRLKREAEDYSEYKKDLVLEILNEQNLLQFFMQDCDNDIDKFIDKYAFFTRYCFSCLVDADSIDTADFCKLEEHRTLKADFLACLRKVDHKCIHFECKTKLQKTRSILQQQAFQKINQNAEIYLMNMPTGSGKTLCSVKFAFERAISENKKKIIYIIPYNSIIDQTAEVFCHLFQEDLEILRHQSTFIYENEDLSESYVQAAKAAEENWDAPFIITTAVQFFESIYSNKRKKLRKLHNMSDSILIFDEAHLMPVKYLQPCLQAISYITRYLHSEAIFLTATMPDFKQLMKEYVFPNSKILDLITDTRDFELFKKCSFRYLGEISLEKLMTNTEECPSSLIIVNDRKTARKIYNECSGEKYHLSTYMTAYDRKKVLKKIQNSLEAFENDYPDYENIPKERKITIVSTSLIEAGVDLDVHTVFRELTGLDSILQAGGRCNREGKRENAETFIFEMIKDKKSVAFDERKNITKGIIEKYDDISCPQSIQEYYDRLFFLKKDEIQQYTMSNITHHIDSIPFREYAEKFELIDSAQYSVVIPQNEECKNILESIDYVGIRDIRKLQNYTSSVYKWELDDLISQHVVKMHESGICYLTNIDYYDENVGILFEAQDYFL